MYECIMYDDSQTAIKRLNRGAQSRQTDDLDKSRHICRYRNPNIIHTIKIYYSRRVRTRSTHTTTRYKR